MACFYGKFILQCRRCNQNCIACVNFTPTPQKCKKLAKVSNKKGVPIAGFHSMDLPKECNLMSISTGDVGTFLIGHYRFLPSA